MNIFYVDEDPVRAAQALCDAHVVKMCVETLQILSTTQHGHLLEVRAQTPNHPSCVWARTTRGNHAWLCHHALALCEEYTYRYARTHALQKPLENYIPKYVYGQSSLTFSPPPLVMPVAYRRKSAVVAYREYYREEKRRFARYTLREPPSWMRSALAAPPSLPMLGPKKRSGYGALLSLQPSCVVVRVHDNQCEGFPLLLAQPVTVRFDGTTDHPDWKLGPGYKRPLKELAEWHLKTT